MVILLLIILIVLFFIAIQHWQKGKDLRKKTLLEDTLKHIYMSNKDEIPATLDSIKGHQKISDKSALDIIGHLIKNKLVVRRKNTLYVTDEGKKYALNIIRNHRLWERYLAEESGVKVEDWHIEAEKMEHKLTDEQRLELRKKLGNPLKDPHGDVIPGEAEDDFEICGEQLSEITLPGNYKIMHIEDEPHEVYMQILSKNLFPGMVIEVVEINNQEMKIKTLEDEFSITKTLAYNINVVPTEENLLEGIKKLSELKIGEEAVVVKISEKIRGTKRRRLLDLGIIPGSKIKVMYENISGNPRAYEVKNTLIALRNDTASEIYVKEND